MYTSLTSRFSQESCGKSSLSLSPASLPSSLLSNKDLKYTVQCLGVTCSDLRQRVNLHDEVFLQAEEADDGEEVDEDESEQRRQQDGAAVTSHTLYHVKQRLLPIDQVKQLHTQT